MEKGFTKKRGGGVRWGKDAGSSREADRLG